MDLAGIKNFATSFLGEELGNKALNSLVAGIGGEALQGLYSKLGATEQNMMTEMLTTDPAFKKTLEDMAGKVGLGDGQDIFSKLDTGMLNTAIKSLYGDPEGRSQTLGTLLKTFTGSDAAPARDPSPVDPAAKPAANGFLQDLMGKVDMQNIMGNLMELPFMKMISQVMEQFLGISLGDLFGSKEVMAQSNDPSGMGPAGVVLTSMMDPQSLVHQVGPDNAVTTRMAAEVTAPAHKAATVTVPNPELGNSEIERAQKFAMPGMQ